MKTLFLLCISCCFWVSIQAQISTIKNSPNKLQLTSSYTTTFWSYHAPIKVETFDRTGIAFNPSAPKKQKITFNGDSLLINFYEKNFLRNPIIKLDSLENNPFIKILNYENAILESDTASFKYTIVGKKGGTPIEINLEVPILIQIKEGETYQIDIQLLRNKEAMKPGAYLPNEERKSTFRT